MEFAHYLELSVWSVVVGAVFVWLWKNNLLARRGRLPPGPPGLPIIGNLHQLGNYPYRTLARWSKTYGPLISLRLGTVPVIVASSPAMAMQVMQTLDKKFAGRPVHISAPLVIYGCPIFFSQPGPYLKLMRQLCSSDFFTNKRIEHFRPIRLEERHALLRSIFTSQGKPVSVIEKAYRTNSNLVSRMTMGRSLHDGVSVNGRSFDMVSIVAEIMSKLIRYDLGDYLPFLAWLDLKGHGKECRQLHHKIKDALQAVIENRRREHVHNVDAGANETPHDLLDVLLSASVNTKYEALQIKDANIRAVLLDMFVAGIDTSSITVEWAFAELLTNPEMLKKLQDELDDKIGTSRFVEEADMPNLPYLRAVVNEAMRLHPFAPILVPRLSLEACELEGYHIPAKTVVYVNVWAIQTDPNVWENPLEFRPERFLNSPLLDAIPGQDFGFSPFGVGRRGCPGWKLGLLNVQIVLANLVHAFNWTLPDGKPRLKEKFGIVIEMDEPVKAVPSPRLPLSLYDTLM